MFIHPVPSPNCREFTSKEEIVATVETFNVRVVIEDVTIDPVLKENELKKLGSVDKYLEEPRP